MGHGESATCDGFRVVQALRDLADEVAAIDWCRGPTSGPPPDEARLAYTRLHGAAGELDRGRVGEAVALVGDALRALRAVDADEQAARCAALSESMEFGL